MNAAEIIKALRTATPAERKQIAVALGADATSAALTPLQVAGNITAIREAFACLNEVQAVAMLSPNQYTVWGTTTGELVDVLAPWLDAHWEELGDELGAAALICGTVGKSVLWQVEKQVQTQRRARGAVEVAHIGTLIEMAEAKAKEESKGDQPADLKTQTEAAHKAASEAYEVLLADYANTIGTDGSAPIFGGFSLRDIALLKRCSKFIQQREPHIWTSDWKRLNERLADLYGRCKREGIDPFVRADRHKIKAERAKMPNVLFKGLRAGEPDKWGGNVLDVHGAPDDGMQVWGGGRDFNEMHTALRRYLKEKHGQGNAGVEYLLP